MVMVCAPGGNAMLGKVEMVTVMVAGFTPSKLTLGWLNLHVAPAGNPEQLLGAKFTTAATEPAIALMVTVAEVVCPAETEVGFSALAVSWKSGASDAFQAVKSVLALTEPSPVT